ncbi:MAG: ABC transporter permease, partial [Acidobacteriota bacterium]|nr:ABC transporter permease [Acidobacteriota bacterium]
MLRRNPGFTLTALVTLALGLGVNASISSLYAGIVLRPVPIPDPDRVVRLLRTSATGSGTAFSHPQFRAYQDLGPALSTLVATSDAVVVLSTITGTERSTARLVSGEYFKVAPASTIAGRLLGSADAAGVVLNERVWRRHFAGQLLASHTVALNGVSFPVVGVVRADAPGPSFEPTPDVWAPLAAHALLNPGSTLWSDDAARWLSIYARLSDVSAGQHVSDSLTAVDRERAPADSASTRVTLVPAARRSAEEQARFTGASATATAAGMVVTLIACLNLAALLLSRSVQRQQEFALRGAIGASTGRLIAQLLVESLVLAFAAAVLGLAAAWVSAPLVRDLSGAPAWTNAAPDWRIAAWSFAVAGAAGVLVCVFPIVQIVRRGRGSGGLTSVSTVGTGSVLGRWLVGIEVCGATVLLVVAVLLTRGVARAHEMPFGFAVDNMLGVSLDLRAHGIPLAQAGALGQQIEERLERIPGVQAVARTQFLPLDSSGMRSVTRDGAAFVTLNYHQVSADYFGAMGIDLLWGRTFTAAEMTAPIPVAVINERLARKLGSPRDLLGTSLGSAHADLSDVVIVGITRDALVSDPRDTTAVYVYRPLRARAALDTSFVVRTTGAADLWTSQAEHAVRLANPELCPLVGGVANRLSGWVEPARAGARAAGIVALLAVTLSLV